MKRWRVGLALGMLLGWAAQGAAQESDLLEEVPLEAARGTTLSIPPGYGRLVSATVSSEVHHLYFENPQGEVRIVLIGPKGALQRARHGFQLLSRDVFLIERETVEAPAGSEIERGKAGAQEEEGEDY